MDRIHDAGAGRLFRIDWVPGTPALVPTPVASVWEARGTLEDVLERVQTWAAGDSGVLMITTRDAESDPAQAAIAGLVRSAQSEHPDRFMLFDLPSDVELTEALVRDAAAVCEPQIAMRDGKIVVPRLASVRRRTPQPLLLPGTVVVTGGTGGVGALIARHLVDAYHVPRLILLSRRGIDTPGAEQLRAELTESGAEVDVVACDAADRDGLKKLLDSVPDLSGVVHAAGALDDGVIASLDPERLHTVMRPKIDAAWNLHHLTLDRDLSMFVLFSSVSSTFGSAGQGNYAAANAALEALAHHRVGLGLPAVALAWGLWEQTSGMTGHLKEVDRRRTARDGVLALSSHDGLALFDAGVAADHPALVAARLDLSCLDSILVSRLKPARVKRGTVSSNSGTLADRIAGMPARQRTRTLTDLVRDTAAEVLGHAGREDIGADDSFRDLGVDSLTAVELRNRLSMAAGLTLPSTLVFDHPTARSVAERLETELLGQVSETAHGADERHAVPGLSDDPIVIVSMACRYPGGVGSPEQLWTLLADERDALTEFPTDRGWNIDHLYHPDPDHPGTSYTRFGGFLDDVAGFDAGLFGISPREALVMDPQQRLLLESTWELLERAGIG
ncbi:SDR family NAD(P)-dependent oxidoreductase, partial [Rhodococcus sp. NPDC003318]|uniref:type I polyketide synthase n=1 Tax=Rhodococcus sp. NPDC003318 TaxID=3364503 RepID=UPI0036C8B333